MTDMNAAQFPLLDVRNLSVAVPGRAGKINVVHDVSFKVDRNEALGIVGESGCGKSVSMLAITGLLGRGAFVSGGSARFMGEELVGAAPARLNALRGDRIAFIFQDPMAAFNPVIRIGEQVSEPLIYKKGLSRKDARTRAGELFDMVGIPGAARRLDDYPHQFSGGMRQRAMIAMALACDPELLIADEPTTALDVTIQAQIAELVQQIALDTGMGLIWITHDLALISGLVDRISVFYAGRVVEEAETNALYQRPSHPYTQGLLASLPRLEGDRGGDLPSIPGTPPDPAAMPPGCAFAPRCPQVIQACNARIPPLHHVTTSSPHRVNCIQVSPEAEKAPVL
ncbi:MAG: ABC transporter ATP-binding protein [Hyphomicrobiales bacterium]